LIINTSTTIVTFLMVFLIQNTQNRDAEATHLKLDELIKATQGARNSMIDLDELSDQQLKQLEAEYKRICEADEQSNGTLKRELEERQGEEKGSKQ
jgi:low affinity Fe/Cu permease